MNDNRPERSLHLLRHSGAESSPQPTEMLLVLSASDIEPRHSGETGIDHSAGRFSLDDRDVVLSHEAEQLPAGHRGFVLEQEPVDGLVGVGSLRALARARPYLSDQLSDVPGIGDAEFGAHGNDRKPELSSSLSQGRGESVEGIHAPERSSPNHRLPPRSTDAIQPVRLGRREIERVHVLMGILDRRSKK